MLNRECYCRKADLNDDIRAIAKYIHFTDPYIYPAICAEYSDTSWIELIGSCLACEDNVFYVDNILVAVYDDKIIGIACVIPCGERLSFDERIKVPDNISDTVKAVAKGYFKPLIEESMGFNGHNVVNICIDEAYRGKGFGRALMAHCVEKYTASPIHLDVIASNVTAVDLYKSFGFKIVDEYFGFSGNDTQLLCYHMIKD